MFAHPTSRQIINEERVLKRTFEPQTQRALVFHILQETTASMRHTAVAYTHTLTHTRTNTQQDVYEAVWKKKMYTLVRICSLWLWPSLNPNLCAHSTSCATRVHYCYEIKYYYRPRKKLQFLQCSKFCRRDIVCRCPEKFDLWAVKTLDAVTFIYTYVYVYLLYCSWVIFSSLPGKMLYFVFEFHSGTPTQVCLSDNRVNH